MDRLKLWLLPVYVVVGFIALLVALPKSRWVVLSQVEAFSGAWRENASNLGLSPGPNYVRPAQRGLENGNLDDSPTAKFLQMVQPVPNDLAVDDYEKRIDWLYRTCMAEGAAEYLALFVRVGSINAMVRDGESKPPSDLARRKRIVPLLLKACEEGHRKDPGNAYFPIIASGAYYQIGESENSRQALLEASRCQEYRDYIRFEPEMRYEYLVDKYGYRGNQLRAWILMETLLQHVTVIRSISIHYAKFGTPTERVAVAKVGGLMVRHDQSFIGVIIGEISFLCAVNPSIPAERILNDKTTDFPKAASALDAMTPGNDGLVEIARDVEKLRNFDQMHWPNEENADAVSNMREAWSGWSLLSLLLLPATLAIAVMKGRGERFAAASPYLVWGTAFLTEPLLGAQGEAGSVVGLAILLFIPALWPKLRRATDLCGLLVAIAGFSLVYPSIAFVLALLVQRRQYMVPAWLNALFVVAVSLAGAGAWTYFAITTGGGDGLVFGTGFTLALACALPALKKPTLPVVAGIGCLLLGGFHATMVYRDLAADRQLGVICDLLLNEANHLREGAGVRP